MNYGGGVPAFNNVNQPSGRSDNFNRADTASAIGTPSDGGSAWIQGIGTWGIDGTQGYCSALVDSGTYMGDMAAVYLEVGVMPNIDIRVTNAAGLNNQGIVFRAVDGTHFFFYYMYSSVVGPGDFGGLYAWNMHDSWDMDRFAAFDTVAMNGVQYRLTQNSSGLVTVYQDGIIIGSGNYHNGRDINPLYLNATKHGLFQGFDSGGRFENFSITSLT